MKKSKLLLSLAMICLSIAVLCFGVLAATSVTYTISGTISYDVTDVFAYINTKVFKVAGQTSSADMKTNVNALATTDYTKIGGSATTSSSSLTYIDTNQSIAVYDTTSDETASRSFNISIDNEYMTYYIVINIQNLASKAINAQLTDTTTYTNLSTATKLVQNGIAKDDTKNLIVAFSITDKTISISGINMSYTVEVGYLEYDEPKTFQVDLQNGDTYWYITLGTYNSNPIKWRLVSLDGSTRYDYTSAKPTEHDGAIFVQETYTTTSQFNKTTSDGNTYNGSVIQTYLKGLETFGSDNAYGITSDPGYIASYTDTDTTNGAVNGDKFWLLSRNQAVTFYADDEDRILYNGSTPCEWWLRTPASLESNVSNDGACIVWQNQGITAIFVRSSYAVRAAFQLA